MGLELCTGHYAFARHLSVDLAPSPRGGRVGRTLCDCPAYDEDAYSRLRPTLPEHLRRIVIAELPVCGACKRLAYTGGVRRCLSMCIT